MVSPEKLLSTAEELSLLILKSKEYKQLVSIRKELHKHYPDSYSLDGEILEGKDHVNLQNMVNGLDVVFETKGKIWRLEYPSCCFDRMKRFMVLNAEANLQIPLMDVPKFISNSMMDFMKLKIIDLSEQHLFKLQLSFMNLATNIKDHPKGLDIAYEICALFINSTEEDRNVFDPVKIKAKIDLWKKAANIKNRFLTPHFFLSVALICLQWFDKR